MNSGIPKISSQHAVVTAFLPVLRVLDADPEIKRIVPHTIARVSTIRPKTRFVRIAVGIRLTLQTKGARQTFFLHTQPSYGITPLLALLTKFRRREL